MATRTMVAALVLAVVAASAAAQTVHIVGGSTGWTIPSGAAFYSTWASNQNYAVGDILVFNFPSGAHDVAKVTKTAYDSCSSTNPISLQANPPANVTLSTSGQHYFICTFGQHCSAGQKLAVNVLATSGSPPAATPTASPSPAPPTPSPTASPAPSPSPAQSPTPTPSPTPSPAPTPSPTQSPTPTPSPAASSPAPTNSPPPPPAGESPTESTSPSDSPTESTTSPPPPGSSAPRKAVAAFGMVVVSVALSALF